VYYRLHPHLPAWLAETIAQLSAQASLTLEQQRLLHMGSDRPQRQTSCCPI